MDQIFRCGLRPKKRMTILRGVGGKIKVGSGGEARENSERALCCSFLGETSVLVAGGASHNRMMHVDSFNNLSPI